MDNENKAFRYYDDMMLNYFKWQKGGVDSKACHGRFINAAIALAQQGMPNPFTYTQPVEDNAFPWPTAAGQIVTGVEVK